MTAVLIGALGAEGGDLIDGVVEDHTDGAVLFTV
jgi:hypothetical protein